MQITEDLPDVIVINEVIPKAQCTPIDKAQLSIDLFFDLGSSSYRGIAMYVSNQIKATSPSLVSSFHESNSRSCL